jgi:hypothetical protein
MCVLSTHGSAQEALPSASLGRRLPSASLQIRLPSAALPQRPLDVPLRRPRRDLFRAGPRTYAPTFNKTLPFDPRFIPCCGVVGGGPFLLPGFVPSVVDLPGFFPGFANASGPGTVSWKERSYARKVPPAEWLGLLRLIVEPSTAQVYVDGFSVGTVADLRQLVTLAPGPHRVELRAPGSDPVAFDVNILPTETITYRTTLRQNAPTDKPVPSTPAAPKALYVIPKCYAGNRPPDPGTLPKTCDVAQLRVTPPVVK